MKKILAVLAAAFVVVNAQAQVSLSGHIRAGASAKVDDDNALDTDLWRGGDYFGGSARTRIEGGYEGEKGGITFRYQHYGFDDLLSSDSIEWLMAYANLLDGRLIAEAGLLTDRFTSTGGWEDLAIDGGKGARVVLIPFDGLYLTASISDLYADTKYKSKEWVWNDDAGDNETDTNYGNTAYGYWKGSDEYLEFDERVFGFSAKYETDAFFVTAGFSPAMYLYGSFGLTSVEDLTFVAEVFYDGTADTDAEDNTMLVGWAEYTGIEKFLFGAAVYTWIGDDEFYQAGNYFAMITPAVSYDFTDIIQLSAESTIYLNDDSTDLDTFVTITPAVTFKASDSAEATVYATLSTDDDQYAHRFGAGVIFNF